MRRMLPVVLVGALLGVAAGPASAQDGFALKGAYLFNSSAVNEAGTDSLPSVDGFGLGVEYVLPFGVGVGVSGYTSGGISDFDVDNGNLVVLAEANYFFNIPILPVSPYAGVHAGLGRYTRDDFADPQEPEIRDSRSQLGYQVGLRMQLTDMLGLDAQWRRVSTSAAEDQSGRLERNQVLLGVTLF